MSESRPSRTAALRVAGAQGTYLPRFYGLHRWKPDYGSNVRFVVMNNVFATNLVPPPSTYLVPCLPRCLPRPRLAAGLSPPWCGVITVPDSSPPTWSNPAPPRCHPLLLLTPSSPPTRPVPRPRLTRVPSKAGTPPGHKTDLRGGDAARPQDDI